MDDVLSCSQMPESGSETHCVRLYFSIVMEPDDRLLAVRNILETYL